MKIVDWATTDFLLLVGRPAADKSNLLLNMDDTESASIIVDRLAALEEPEQA